MILWWRLRHAALPRAHLVLLSLLEVEGWVLRRLRGHEIVDTSLRLIALMVCRARGRLWLIGHQMDIVHPLWNLSTRINLLLIDRFYLLHLLLGGGQCRWGDPLLGRWCRLLLCRLRMRWFWNLRILLVITLWGVIRGGHCSDRSLARLCLRLFYMSSSWLRLGNHLVSLYLTSYLLQIEKDGDRTSAGLSGFS